MISGIFSPEEGNTIATCSYYDDEITFYDIRKWQILKQLTFKDEIYDIMWDKSGTVFFVADMKGRISLFDGTLSSNKTQPAV